MTVVDVADVKVRRVTDEEAAAYRRDGWVKIAGLIGPEVAAQMLEEARRYRADAGPAQALSIDTPMWHAWRNVARDAKQEPFRSVAYNPRIGENLSVLEGHHGGVRYWQDTVSCKAPASERDGNGPTGWHQDFPNHPIDRLGGGTVWIALDDVSPDQGAMSFFSGSHRAGPLGRTYSSGPRSGGGDQLAENPWIRDEYSQSEPFALKAGDATFHHPLTVHGAGTNVTDRPRWSFIVFFAAAAAVYTGASYPDTDGLDLEVGKPFDHPAFPVVWPGIPTS
jgi:ectoine hydroxylase-related dioxygenase (phytanoyl-CoA dioxygenase family)